MADLGASTGTITFGITQNELCGQNGPWKPISIGDRWHVNLKIGGILCFGGSCAKNSLLSLSGVPYYRAYKQRCACIRIEDYVRQKWMLIANINVSGPTKNIDKFANYHIHMCPLLQQETKNIHHNLLLKYNVLNTITELHKMFVVNIDIALINICKK